MHPKPPFPTRQPTALLSTLFRILVADADDADDEPLEVPLPNVSSHILEKIVEFCTHYAMSPMPQTTGAPQSYELRHAVTDWYADFVAGNENLELVMDLLSAVHYLDIKSLQDLTATKIATIIKDMPREQLLEAFGDPADRNR